MWCTIDFLVYQWKYLTPQPIFAALNLIIFDTGFKHTRKKCGKERNLNTTTTSNRSKSFEFINKKSHCTWTIYRKRKSLNWLSAIWFWCVSVCILRLPTFCAHAEYFSWHTIWIFAATKKKCRTESGRKNYTNADDTKLGEKKVRWSSDVERSGLNVIGFR